MKPGLRAPEWASKLLERVIAVAGIGCVLSLAYILFVVMSGGLSAQIVAGTALTAVARNMSLAARVFLWCLWIVVIGFSLRRAKLDSMGLVVMATGFGLWALLPMLIRARTGLASAQALVAVAQGLITAFQASGSIMIVLGFLRFAVGRVIQLASPTRTAAQFTSASGEAALAAERALEKPSLMRKCYELHFCRAGLRTNCPRFLEGVSCWKRRSGCYCDQGLATRLLTGMGANSRAAMAEELHAAQRRAAQGKRPSKQKAPCGECPIYLEHQKHKYRVISWFAYPAAAILIGLSIVSLRNGYQWLDWRLSGWLNQFQLLPHELTDKPLEVASWLSAENIAIVVIAVLLVGLLLQLTELVIFRIKL